LLDSSVRKKDECDLVETTLNNSHPYQLFPYVDYGELYRLVQYRETRLAYSTAIPAWPRHLYYLPPKHERFQRLNDWKTRADEIAFAVNRILLVVAFMAIASFFAAPLFMPIM
jgi:hypothetical protein